MNKIKRYFRGVWEQGKMVRWPKRKDLLTSVGIVLGVVIVAAIALVISDTIVSALLKSLDSQFSGGKDATTETVAMLSSLFLGGK